MAITSQTHREFSGRGHLLRDSRPPVAVSYYIMLSARPTNTSVLAGPHETQWEWDKAQGFLTLSDDTDALDVDIRAKYTLVLDDDTRCVPTLCHDHNLPLMKYRLQCSPRDLLGQGSNAILYGRSAPRPVYEATGQAQ